ncbi:MAG: hypothetical protein ACT4PJ_03015 [Gemmatimonadaceae bacterium]
MPRLRVLHHSARVALTLGVAACAPQVAESPHVSLQHLREAVEAGDTAATLEYVDLDAIGARLVRDIINVVEDSIGVPFPDSLNPQARARLDSMRAQWRRAFRKDLGLPPASPAGSDSPDSLSSESQDDAWQTSPDEGVMTTEVEIVGDGKVTYRGDTALVPRVIRHARLDTTLTLQLALVPVERRHWRVVALPNMIALARALEARKAAVFERANQPWRDSIATRIVVTQFRATEEPLVEWGRYAARVRVTIQNRSASPISVRTVQLLGPSLALDDSVGEVIRKPISFNLGGRPRWSGSGHFEAITWDRTTSSRALNRTGWK